MTSERTQFLEAAAAIGADLCRDAIWDGPRCNWLGDSMEPLLGGWNVVLRSFSMDLYGGTSGVGLFLARLYQLTGERIDRATAEGAVAHCLSQWDQLPPHVRLSYYAGSVGIANALIEIGEALGRSDLVELALDKLSSHIGVEPGPFAIDVINGRAGAIPPLLRLGARYSCPQFIDRAIQLGEDLLAYARKGDTGWSWTTMDPAGSGAKQDLTGFSHGTAGVVWALAELYHQTGRADFVEAARQGIRYEQSFFQPDVGNWPDFRGEPVQQANGPARFNCSLAWCHGAPGIALGRLRTYQITRDMEVRKQAETAVQTTARSLTGVPGKESYSLCHGIAGNTEALIYASSVLGEPTWLRLARQTGLRGIESYHLAGADWPCGIPGGESNPSLLLGLAGIGYFYLRLIEPERFPSVLIPCSAQ